MTVPDTIQWRVHLSSPKENVFEMLATDRGRRQFWAEEATEVDGRIHFTFVNGYKFVGKVIEKQSPARFVVEYFGGSTVHFELGDDGAGGTDLTMTEMQVPESSWMDNFPGWIPVLLALKAAVDFSVDLRSHDPERAWGHGYVDV